MDKVKCCFCGQVINLLDSNNPEGAVGQDNKAIEWEETDRCCDTCNLLYVIPGRLYLLKNSKQS